MDFPTLIGLSMLASVLAAGTVELRIPLPEKICALHPELIQGSGNSTTQDSRIIGGCGVETGEAPYQVAIYHGISFICGGALIGSKVVLTTAHCVYGFESNVAAFTVRYGNANLSKTIELPVASIARHPNYSPTTFDNDIALLKLPLPIKPSTGAAALTLPLLDPSDFSTLTVTGWGRTSASGSNTLPSILQKASVKVMPRAECAIYWQATNSVTARMICAHNEKQSACAGDTGGPVVNNGVLVGLVSWGPSTCVHDMYPNVYTSVASFRTWIESQIN